MPDNKPPQMNKDKSDEVKATFSPKPVEPTPEPKPVVEEAPPVVVHKVEYVGGQGIELAYPLSNGLRSFVAGQVYELTNYGDFCRLTEASKHFVEVKDAPKR